MKFLEHIHEIIILVFTEYALLLKFFEERGRVWEGENSLLYTKGVFPLPRNNKLELRDSKLE